MRLKIAFSGKMRTGKDEAYAYISKYIPDVTLLKFADPVYDIMNYAQTVCGFPHIKDRQFLQYIGTEYARSKNPNVWVDVFLRRASEIDGPIVCTDARFTNEFVALKNAGFTLVKISADETIRIARGAESLVHASEVDMDLYENFDYVIENNGTLSEFHTKLFTILSDKVNVSQFV